MVTPILPVRLSDVTVRRRGKTILGPLDLEIGGTGFSAVLGPNGAGKTTFLRVLHGVERVSSGKLTWQIETHAAQIRQAYVFQSPIMMRRSVAENLAYPLTLARRPRDEIAKEVGVWADRIGLADLLGAPATRLSGGEKQKLALARALIRAPDLLFLDEPCANLDGRSTREFETILRSAMTAGTRIIMTTHDLGQARRLSDEVFFLRAGQVTDYCNSESFFAGDVSASASAFLRGDIVE